MAPGRRYLTLIALFCVCSLDQLPGTDAAEFKIEVVKSPPSDCTRMSNKYDVLTMHYTGYLTKDGTESKFDSSHDRQQPFQFQIGVGQVIQGWEQGLLGMCVGETRKLTIPADMAYGAQGAGELIPPNSDLAFEVTLININDGDRPPNVFKEIDANDDKYLTKDEVSSYLKEQQKMAEPNSPPVSDEQHDTIVTQIFQHEDKDLDGRISHAEFSGPKHDEL